MSGGQNGSLGLFENILLCHPSLLARVDPGAPGLSRTSDGRTKIIDVVEASGSGDVLMTGQGRASEGTLVGLSGRTLRLNPDWVNPSGVFKLGLKPGFEFFPQGELLAAV